MKTTFTLLLVLAAVTLTAQPTLTYSNVGPQAGDSFDVHSLTGWTDPGASGANVTWDFSDLGDGNTSVL
ncbi:MAG: hypothetical protein SH856_05535 [Flavobacteriales bacterium]|nr:hypothetical protein [Flavobacteriales bacterium]